jgi:hypothetical protein
MTNEILIGLSIIVNVLVGVILYNQIKSQKALIEQYKGYVEAVNPEKIIKLHDRQIELITSLNNQSQSQLKQQIFELGWFAVHQLTIFERSAKSVNDPNFFYSTNATIQRNMPNCVNVLTEIKRQYDSHLNTPNA